MSVKNISVLLSILFTTFFFFSCEEDTFHTDLDKSFLTPHDTTTSNIQLVTYQVPPIIGGMKTLYLGKIHSYTIPLILLKPGNLDLLSDSLIFVDSAYFYISIDTSSMDTVDLTTLFELGFIEVDSTYSEGTTNFSNIDWIPEEFPILQSYISSDTAGNQFLKFDIVSQKIETWADTSQPDSMFILQLSDDIQPHLIAFYSSESSSRFPYLKVFYHIQSDTSLVPIDTSLTISMTSDISIVFPPSLNVENFDSARAYLSAGAGLRTLVSMNIDSLHLPRNAVIINAYLKLFPDASTSYFVSDNKFEIQLFALEDSMASWNDWEIYSEDNFSHGSTLDMISGRTFLENNFFKLNVTHIVQALLMNRYENRGFKLLAMNSGSIFDYLSIHLSRSDSHQPNLEVFYEIP